MPRTATTGHHWVQVPEGPTDCGAARDMSMPSFWSCAMSSSTSRVEAPLLRARSRVLTKRCDNSLTTRRIVVFWNRGGNSGQAVSLYCFMVPNVVERLSRIVALPYDATKQLKPFS